MIAINAKNSLDAFNDVIKDYWMELIEEIVCNREAKIVYGKPIIYNYNGYEKEDFEELGEFKITFEDIKEQGLEKEFLEDLMELYKINYCKERK